MPFTSRDSAMRKLWFLILNWIHYFPHLTLWQHCNGFPNQRQSQIWSVRERKVMVIRVLGEPTVLLKSLLQPWANTGFCFSWHGGQADMKPATFVIIIALGGLGFISPLLVKRGCPQLYESHQLYHAKILLLVAVEGVCQPMFQKKER